MIEREREREKRIVRDRKKLKRKQEHHAIPCRPCKGVEKRKKRKEEESNRWMES